jgi:hypothetical protein
VNCLPRLASNHNPPDLNLPSSWDYRREPPVPGSLMPHFCTLFPFPPQALEQWLESVIFFGFSHKPTLFALCGLFFLDKKLCRRPLFSDPLPYVGLSLLFLGKLWEPHLIPASYLALSPFCGVGDQTQSLTHARQH